jgi:Tfp pilus assembly protein PilO
LWTHTPIPHARSEHDERHCRYDDTWTWPEVVLILGLLLLAFLVFASIYAGVVEQRKTRAAAHQDESLRQLVRRYEQLAENASDTQQRIATDLAELRTRTTAIEHILRSVE